jgi:hypothetical protein
MHKLVLYIGLLALLSAAPAYAYIGPGAGAGTIAVVLGVLASILLAFIAIIWYPIKRLFKGRKKSSGESAEKESDTE